MSYDPADGFPAVVPALLYRDLATAIPWLSRVFGFAERLRLTADDGTVLHCDMDTGLGGAVMLEQAPAGYVPPRPQGKNRSFLLVAVADVDAHHSRSVAEGAILATAPADRPWGLRQYLVHDLGGHTWEFCEFRRAVPPEAWGATSAGQSS